MSDLQGKLALTTGASSLATLQARPQIAEEFEGGEDEIAVVGMGLTVAGANDTEEFWQVMINGPDLFTEVPHVRWNHSLFHSTNLYAEDKTYQQNFAFITDFEPTPRLKREIGLRSDECELTTLWLRHSLYQALEGVKRHNEAMRTPSRSLLAIQPMEISTWKRPQSMRELCTDWNRSWQTSKMAHLPRRKLCMQRYRRP